MKKNEILFEHRYISDTSELPFRAHVHDKWEFILLPQSNAFCVVEGKRYQLKDTTLAMIKPANIHRIQFNGYYPYEYYSLMCDIEELFPQESIQLLSAPSVFDLESDCEMLRMFLALSQQNQYGNARSRYGANRLVVKEIVSGIIRLSEQKKMIGATPINPIVHDAVTYIEDNIQKAFCIDDICAAVGVNRNKLYNLFINHMVMAPTKYIRMKRMALLQVMEESGPCRNELRRLCGFRDEASFKRAWNATIARHL